ncbi:hypothetical protein [Yersinia thracica]|uniref:hypothetical protein n=1 Tax=Yersinia thracica TaxID=2890319 RepID=UPI00067ADA00|nr:hypothetical protein [Yersinia thracica]
MSLAQNFHPLLPFRPADAAFAIPAYGLEEEASLKIPTFEWHDVPASQPTPPGHLHQPHAVIN